MNLNPERLGALGPFRGVPKPDLLDLCQHIHGRHLEPGEVLFVEGDPAKSAAIVLSGRLGITIHTATGPVSVGDMWPGDLVGDAALLDRNGHRNATVTATMATDCALFEPDMLELLPTNRGVIVLEQHLLRHMAKRIRAANFRLERAWKDEPEPIAPPHRTAEPTRATAPASAATPLAQRSFRSTLLRILGVS